MTAAMSASVELTADVETVWAVLTSASWPQALDAHLRDGSALVSSEPVEGGSLRVTTSRLLPAGGPSFLRRFAPADGRVTQIDIWTPLLDGVRSGAWAVTFPGSPGRVGGSTRIEPVPAGCRWTVSGTVSVPVPIVGGRVEGFLAPVLEKLVARQGEVLRTVLRQPYS